MSMTIDHPPAPRVAPDLLKDVNAACQRIPPLWDLANYVAVNPFLGFVGTPIDQACGTIEAGLGGRVLPPIDFYCQARREGRLNPESLERAAVRAGVEVNQLEAVLKGGRASAEADSVTSLRTLAELHDAAHGTRLADHVRNDVARWCAVYASDGGPQWGNVVQGRGLFASWLGAARIDRSLEVLGLRGWRTFIRQVPDVPEQAIGAMVERIGVPTAQRTEYFYRLLGRMYGWACYFRREGWQRGSEGPGEVGELMAIQLCADAAVGAIGPTLFEGAPPRNTPDLSVRLALQDALENQYVTGVLKRLTATSAARVVSRPPAQAAFCIDVRSEPLRRHLEAQDDLIQTIGFAGFFGVSLDWRSGPCNSARCPVLLQPSVSVESMSYGQPFLPGAAAQVQAAPSSAFSYVETLGLAYGVRLAIDAMSIGTADARPDEQATFSLEPDGGVQSLSSKEQVNLATGILKNMGLCGPLARIVMLCGHAGRSANNPHAAGLDCGACGGHGGAINARVAASLLNSAVVRSGLAENGVVIPGDTHFLPAVHDTSIDEVRFLDVKAIPASHAADIAALREWLDRAGARTRQERSASLGLDPNHEASLIRLLQRRARDWSEVRPEWGLARNAAFIAARRSKSRGVDLQGRAFLHDYDAQLDTDGSVLTLILSAPMVVASWINLQYFASTVDNDVFGCGDKTLHNRVGSIGVVLGNGGDLRTGLAAQSVHAPDGSWYHEPLRLQVIVESSTEKLDQILASQKRVADLVRNGWVRLYAIESDGSGALRWVSDNVWQPASS